MIEKILGWFGYVPDTYVDRYRAILSETNKQAEQEIELILGLVQDELYARYEGVEVIREIVWKIRDTIDERRENMPLI